MSNTFKRPTKVSNILDAMNQVDSDDIKGNYVDESELSEFVTEVLSKMDKVPDNQKLLSAIHQVDIELRNKTGIGLSETEIVNLLRMNNVKQVNDYRYMRLIVHEGSVDGTELNKLIKSANILDNLADPLKLPTDNINELIGRDARKIVVDKHETAMKKISKFIEFRITQDYITNRDKRTIDGKLDTILTGQELQSIAANVSVIVDSIVKANPGLQGDRIAGSAETINDMNTDFRYRYESFKEIVCNDYGITPESFDEWYKAVAADVELRLDDGIEKRTDLYNTSEAQMKYKHLLKRVDGWKKGDIIWRSEFIKNVDIFERQSLDKSKPHASQQSMELFNAMTKMWHDIDNPAKIKDTGIGSSESRANFIKRRRNKRLSSTVTEKDRIVIDETETKHEVIESNIEHDVVEEVGLWDFVDNSNHEVEVTQENSLDSSSDVVVEDNDALVEISANEQLDVASVRSIDYDRPDYFQTRYKETIDSFNLDDVTPVKKYDSDVAKLRITDPIQRLNAYRESKREGRLLYLVNSGYEVFVKKIKIRDKINYMLQLIQQSDATDLNSVDAAFKTEVLRVIYESIEFDSEIQPTFDEFVKNLNEADLMILITMVALVNTPEDKDGRVPLNVSSVICSNCGKPAYFKEPITLDLKEEFKNMYPVDIYAREYSRYKMAGYKSITDAYRSSSVGGLKVLTGEDEDVVYEVLVSLPTVWKSQQLAVNRDYILYQAVKSEYLNKFESIKTLRPDMELEPVKNYLETHSFVDYRRNLSDIMNLDDEESKSEDNKSIARVLSLIDSEMESMAELNLGFLYLMELIDGINVRIKGDKSTLISNLTLSTPDKMLDIVKTMPIELIEKLTEFRVKDNEKLVPVDIVYTADELAGRFDFEAYYGEDEDARESKRKQLIGMGYDGNELDAILNDFMNYRDEIKSLHNNDGMCANCRKKEEYKVNYTNILFFWTSKVLQ